MDVTRQVVVQSKRGKRRECGGGEVHRREGGCRKKRTEEGVEFFLNATEVDCCTSISTGPKNIYIGNGKSVDNTTKFVK